MLVNLVFDYYTDVIDVPTYIASNIKKYQNRCDRWIFAHENQFWVKDKSGKKLCVNLTSEAFVYWLNKFILKDNDEKAVIIKRDLKEYDSSLPTLFY